MTRPIDAQPNISPASLDPNFIRQIHRLEHSERMSNRPTGGEAYVFDGRLVIPPGSSYPLSRREALRLAHPVELLDESHK